MNHRAAGWGRVVNRPSRRSAPLSRTTFLIASALPRALGRSLERRRALAPDPRRRPAPRRSGPRRPSRVHDLAPAEETNGHARLRGVVAVDDLEDPAGARSPLERTPSAFARGQACEPFNRSLTTYRSADAQAETDHRHVEHSRKSPLSCATPSMMRRPFGSRGSTSERMSQVPTLAHGAANQFVLSFRTGRGG